MGKHSLIKGCRLLLSPVCDGLYFGFVPHAVTMRQALCPSVETQEGGTDGSSYTGGNGLERNTADGQRLRRLSSQDKEDQGLNWRHDRRD